MFVDSGDDSEEKQAEVAAVEEDIHRSRTQNS